jgi:hypothetical protein
MEIPRFSFFAAEVFVSDSLPDGARPIELSPGRWVMCRRDFDALREGRPTLSFSARGRTPGEAEGEHEREGGGDVGAGRELATLEGQPEGER